MTLKDLLHKKIKEYDKLTTEPIEKRLELLIEIKIIARELLKEE